MDGKAKIALTEGTDLILLFMRPEAASPPGSIPELDREMQIFEWRKERWYRYLVVVATIIAIAALASHPELRLLLPLVDALGLDLFVFLVGSQVYTFVQPLATSFHRAILRPALHRAFSVAMFLLGISGPYPEAHVVMPRPLCRFAA